MTRVNRRRIDNKLRRDAWRRLWDAVRRSDSDEAFEKNLGKFLTATEMGMVEKRLAIPVLLARGLSYREICREIDVSQPTVSFVKHGLTRKPRVARRYSSLTKPRRGRTTPFHSHTGRDRWNWLSTS